MLAALLVGRLCQKSRSSIGIVCFCGTFEAMLAHIAVDGQGAFLLLLYAPVIYPIATVGRHDLNLQ